MTKSTITRDQLRALAVKKVESLKFAITQSAFTNIRRGLEEELQLAEFALAAMDSEQVKRVNADQMHHVCLEANRHLDKYGAMAKEVNKLLGRIPAQPASVVPPEQHWEELCRQHPDMSIGDAIIRAAWWNHCRAAMLAATPQEVK